MQNPWLEPIAMRLPGAGSRTSSPRPARPLAAAARRAVWCWFRAGIVCFLCLFATTVRAAEPVNILVSAGTIVTMNAHRDVLHDAAIAVKDGRIVAVGSRTRLEFLYTPKSRLKRPDAILTPGLINAHAHAAMSAAARHRRRPQPAGLARPLHLPRRKEKRYFRICSGRNAPGRPRNDARRHHDLRRHVLLRKRSSPRYARGRHARRAGRDHHRLPRPRQCDAATGAGLHRAFYPRIPGRCADHAGRRAACPLHQLAGHAQGRARARRQVLRPAADARLRNEEGAGRFPLPPRSDAGAISYFHRRRGPPHRFRARRVADAGRHRRARSAARRNRALPIQQHEARQRRRARHRDAGRRTGRRSRHRWTGRFEQRYGPAARARPGRQAGQGHARRSPGPACHPGLRNGDHRGRQGARHGERDRLAGARQTRRFHHDRHHRAARRAGARSLFDAGLFTESERRAGRRH